MDGVSTYLALTFGTLLSSQGTDASFETVSPASPGASLRCFQPYQIRFPVRFRSEFRIRPPAGAGVSRAFRRVHHFSGFPRMLIIEFPGPNSGMPKSIPMRGRAVVVCRRCGSSGCRVSP
ncbi:hypothetical protein DNK48_21655 [Streptomyces malaysiensis subsp. malaysiensis]|nr:hypothetical protein DNK48_21655 [Streptomyces malaysiensis]